MDIFLRILPFAILLPWMVYYGSYVRLGIRYVREAWAKGDTDQAIVDATGVSMMLVVLLVLVVFAAGVGTWLVS